MKRNFASATAARKASTIESATVTLTTIRLFLTPSQKYGPVDRVAEVRERRVQREPRRRQAVDARSSGLNAVVIIQ